MKPSDKKRIEDDFVVTDQETLQKRMIEHEVHKQTGSVVGRMDNALGRLERVLVVLEPISKRQNNHFIWLVAVTIGFIGLGLFSFAIYKSLLEVMEVMKIVKIISC